MGWETGPKGRDMEISPGLGSVGARQLLLGKMHQGGARQSFHPPEKRLQLAVLLDGGSIEGLDFGGHLRRHSAAQRS